MRHVGAERWERTGDLVGGGTVCGAWLYQQRSLKEQADPFLQGVLLGERSRCSCPLRDDKGRREGEQGTVAEVLEGVRTAPQARWLALV